MPNLSEFRNMCWLLSLYTKQSGSQAIVWLYSTRKQDTLVPVVLGKLKSSYLDRKLQRSGRRSQYLSDRRNSRLLRASRYCQDEPVGRYNQQRDMSIIETAVLNGFGFLPQNFCMRKWKNSSCGLAWKPNSHELFKNRLLTKARRQFSSVEEKNTWVFGYPSNELE